MVPALPMASATLDAPYNFSLYYGAGTADGRRDDHLMLAAANGILLSIGWETIDPADSLRPFESTRVVLYVLYKYI